MASVSNNQRESSIPPGRKTRFPILASTQWPGIFSVANLLAFWRSCSDIFHAPASKLARLTALTKHRDLCDGPQQLRNRQAAKRFFNFLIDAVEFLMQPAELIMARPSKRTLANPLQWRHRINNIKHRDFFSRPTQGVSAAGARMRIQKASVHHRLQHRVQVAPGNLRPSGKLARRNPAARLAGEQDNRAAHIRRSSVTCALQSTRHAFYTLTYSNQPVHLWFVNDDINRDASTSKPLGIPMKRLWFLFCFVLAVSFSVLSWIGTRIYQEAPPIPNKVVTTAGVRWFRTATSEPDKTSGNRWAAWRSAVWGHGSYVAPDWTADWLHREAMFILDRWANETYHAPIRQAR